MAPLVFRGRTAGRLTKDAVELRIAAETGLKGRFKQRAVIIGITSELNALEKTSHPLPVAELDDRQPRLLFEQAAEP